MKSSTEARAILKRNVQMLKDNPKAKVRIAGYTSASGTEAYNQELSEKRAAAVEEYLVSEGVITQDRLFAARRSQQEIAASVSTPFDRPSHVVFVFAPPPGTVGFCPGFPKGKIF